MSENLLIKEGQIGRKFSPVDRICANNQGGGCSLWRNAEELEMDSLEVSENGLYVALDEELYAYDTITVDVQEASEEEKKTGKTVVGRDPYTGDDHAVGVDEDGNLTEERVPSEIKIVVLPAKRKYVDGELLNFTGIHVYLMDANNHLFTCDSYPTGEIPFDELVFPVTIADGSIESYPTAYTEDTGTFFFSHSVPTYTKMDGVEEESATEFNVSDDLRSGKEFTAFQKQDGTYVMVLSAKKTAYNWDHSITIKGKTAHYYGTRFANNYSGVSPVNFGQDYSSVNIELYAWAMLYGDITDDSDVIPVQWIRPQDGETLEDTFEIEIVAEHTPEPEPEPEPDPYADHYDFEYQGAKYNFNRSDIRGMSFSGGYVLVTYMDTMQTYTVADALRYNLVVRVSSTHTGGDF